MRNMQRDLNEEDGFQDSYSDPHRSTPLSPLEQIRKSHERAVVTLAVSLTTLLTHVQTQHLEYGRGLNRRHG